MSDRPAVAGWDIGGVNVKAALLTPCEGTATGTGQLEAGHPLERLGSAVLTVRPFEVWRDPGALAGVLRETAQEAGIERSLPMAVSMTAELSDVFATRREGVLRVLAAVRQAFPDAPLHVLDVAGRFVSLDQARRQPLACAATNWVASALVVARHVRECLLVDVGSTTTDIIPIRDGEVVAQGRSDSARLVSGELVYTGVLRTNPNTLAATVPLRGRPCRVAAEWFTQMGDVYVLLGMLSPDEYTCPTPDGRGRSPAEARARLARLVCEDAETQTEGETMAIAQHLYARQVEQVADGLGQVLSRLDSPRPAVLPAGIGGFLAADAARRARLAVLEAEAVLPRSTASALPAAAAASLLADRLWGSRP